MPTLRMTPLMEVGPPRYAERIPGEPVSGTLRGAESEPDSDTLTGPLSKRNQNTATC
jgi:hypothetical protein